MELKCNRNNHNHTKALYSQNTSTIYVLSRLVISLYFVTVLNYISASQWQLGKLYFSDSDNRFDTELNAAQFGRPNCVCKFYNYRTVRSPWQRGRYLL